MTESILVNIDDKEVAVPKGTLVVDAAKRVDNDIPVFCYHPKLDPVGMCRMCLVEVGTPLRDKETGDMMLEEMGNQQLIGCPIFKLLVLWLCQPECAFVQLLRK